MIDFRLYELYTLNLCLLTSSMFISCDESKLSGNGEITCTQEKNLIQQLYVGLTLKTIIMGRILLKANDFKKIPIFEEFRLDLHDRTDRKIF